MSDHDETAAISRSEQLGQALRRVVLLRETGPKSAAWHRARVQTIWRLHRLLEEAGPPTAPAGADAPPEH